MSYTVIVELSPPAGDTPLHPLAAEGAAAVLDRFVAGACEALGPAGAVVTVTDRWIGTHPDGAMVAVVVQAPTPDDAHTAGVELLTHALATIDALTGWTLTRTETRAMLPHHTPVHQPSSQAKERI